MIFPDPGHHHDFEAAKQDGNVEQNDGAKITMCK